MTTSTLPRKRKVLDGWMEGGGPWRILDECAAPLHNTLYAARGRTTGKATRPRCTCPRARTLLELENAKHRARSAARHHVTPLKAERKVLSPWPDLSSGACQTADGLAMFDRARGKNGEKARDVAAWMCRKRCPVRDACALTLTVEYPAGSWGGVIAGMNADQRRKASGLNP